MITAVAQIVRDPNVCGGDPTVAGTRVPVHILVQCWRVVDRDMAALARNYPLLTRAQLDVAIDFYTDHAQEIDAIIAEEKRIVREWTGPRFRPSKP
jgi:uncharacterized protein (DUF433 family)